MQEIFGIAARASSMSAVRDVLRTIAENTGCYGCILWRVASSEPSDEARYLFAAAEWFQDGGFSASHALPFGSSVTGSAIQTAERKVVDDLKHVREPEPFLHETGITMFCTIPITFNEGTRGSLNLYRQGAAKFDDVVLSVASSYAAALPTVLQVIEDAVSLRLSTSLDWLLRSIARPAPRSSSLFDCVAPALEKICQELAGALNCVEASVFLEDYFDTPGEYRLAATTSTPLVRKQSYKASVEDGVTGWQLAHPDMKLVVFDLSTLERISHRYPGLRWVDSVDFRRALALQLNRAVNGPVSFMSAPIMDGDRVAGVVRCSIGRGPMYFGERQLAMLEQTSARVGSALSAVVRNRSLEALVENVKELNQFAHDELMKAAPDENRILEAALEITRRLLPDAERIDVRLLSDDDASLRHSAPDQVIVGDVHPRPAEPASDGSSDQTIIAPLTLGSDVFGVLDVHAATGRHFHDFDVQTTGLLASQLAVYRRLAITVRHLKELVRELNILRDQQVQIHEDLSHQLKSPTITAYRRVDSIVRRMPDSPLKAELLKVRGVCARAMHVTATAGVFAHLARDKAIPVTRTAMSGEELLRLVINTAQDASYIVRGDQKHSFEVRPDGFAAIGAINVDRGLLEQALTQLLDNAFKYSFPKSVVTITAGITRSGRAARISISNEGIPLRSADVARCVDRGWQSEDARDVSDTGSGIGLWVVDKTMQAQGGALEVAPTDRAGRTTFSLLLPL